jgi:hypothetical protein
MRWRCIGGFHGFPSEELFIHARAGNKKSVLSALKSGLSANTIGDYGDLPLLEAAAAGQHLVVCIH